MQKQGNIYLEHTNTTITYIAVFEYYLCSSSTQATENSQAKIESKIIWSSVVHDNSHT